MWKNYNLIINCDDEKIQGEENKWQKVYENEDTRGIANDSLYGWKIVLFIPVGICFFIKRNRWNFSLSATLSKHFIRYNVQYIYIFFLNKKEKKGEKNLLKKKLIFLSIDFDSFFLSRMDICLSMFMTRKEKLYEKMDTKEELWVSSFFLSSVHARMKI